MSLFKKPSHPHPPQLDTSVFENPSLCHISDSLGPLVNLTKKNTIVTDVHLARSFYQRLRGLIGITQLRDSSALWIQGCRSIHTFFMKLNIDAVFVDKQLVVQALYFNLRPGRLTLPVCKATSVFEMAARPHPASHNHKLIEIGDQLRVGN